MDLGFDDLGRIGAGFASPWRRCWASAGASHWPCLVMPIGITSYFVRSMALRMEAAERRETSCWPERPPKRMPIRNFFFPSALVVCFFVMDATSFYYFGFGRRKKFGGVSRWFLQGVLRILACFVVVNRGEVVVNCVVKHGRLRGVFCRR